ncbi:keratin-associated protein 9-1-like isoform X2 [Cydia splendana]|uniref:keratin-associated protein 9-1-like isoform X2 n=1 Tax=Cydia splendana TaxID=1100963 RepID=UPI00300CE6E3
MDARFTLFVVFAVAFLKNTLSICDSRAWIKTRSMGYLIDDRAVCISTCAEDICMASCIAPECVAKCSGLMCSARCEGDGCNATCNGLRCTATCKGVRCFQSAALW